MRLTKKMTALCAILTISISALTGCSSKDASKTLKDGTYSKTADVAENGYKNTMTMTINDGKITAITWDALDEKGQKKSELSLNGTYVMTPNGPTWAAQSESMCKYLIEKQTVDGLKTDDKGKTDAVSGVSISVKGFVDFAKDLMDEASNK